MRFSCSTLMSTGRDDEMTSTTWMTVPDALHPIKWESADGGETFYLSRDDALDRLAHYYIDPTLALDSGHTIRTPFAFYTDTSIPELEKRYLDGDR
jgi:hypothetical protein